MDALDIHTVYTRSSSGHKRAAVKEKEITFTKIKYTIYFLNVPFWKAVGGAVLSWQQQTQCCPRVTLWAPFTSSTIKTLTRNFKETIKEYAHYYVVGIKQSLIWWGWWWAGPAHADTCTLTCMGISCEPAEGCDIHQNHGDTQGEVMQLLTLFSVSWNKSMSWAVFSPLSGTRLCYVHFFALWKRLVHVCPGCSSLGNLWAGPAD